MKKTLISILIMSVLLLSAITPIAAAAAAAPISAESGLTDEYAFGSFSGTVKKITPSENAGGNTYYSVETADGQQAVFVVSKNTYIPEGDEISVGTDITGYFNSKAPMIMIYPPQYSVDAVVVNKEGRNVKADIFDKNLLSSDKSLKLNVSDKTEIATQHGQKFYGDLAGRRLIVFYDFTTKSIPAQTSPVKIVVLDEKAKGDGSSEDTSISIINGSNGIELLINGKNISGQPAYLSAYINARGTIMVPLRAISEYIGLEVGWDNGSQTVTVGSAFSFAVGTDNYKTAFKTVKLGTAPEIIQDRTFVPLIFFTEIIGLANIKN